MNFSSSHFSHEYRRVAPTIRTTIVNLGQPDGSLPEITLQVGQHCEIATEQIHRLANRIHEPVEIVEVQLGSHLGKDDIIRLADDVGCV